jgi:TRAP-type mannitol/chloroaromatic compound transport system permease small subunit
MELMRGGKFAAIGSTVGWLIVGALLTGAINTFMIYVLKYW